MIEEWKARQRMYHHQMDENFDDFIADKPCYVRENQDEWDLCGDIVDYFYVPSTILIYPAKSYAVALIYAQMLTEYFDVEFYTVLNDPDLLYGNDKYFVPYRERKEVYDTVLTHIRLDFVNPTPQVLTTIDYFNKEFFITTA